LNWDGPDYLHSAQCGGIVSRGASKRGVGTAFLDRPFTKIKKTLNWTLGDLRVRAFGGYRGLYSVRSLIESVLMPQRIVFRLVLPAIVGLLVGFLALAWAVPSESTIPVPLVSLFSPGLKVAELVMPAAHESLAWTFGWFLRIAIGVNAVFYFAIFALLAYLADRRRSPTS